MIKNTKFEITNKNKLIYSELFNLRNKTMQACNVASSLQFTELINKRQDIKQDYGKSFQCYVEDNMKKIMDGYNTGNIAQTRAFVFGKSNFNPSEILKGESSLTSYKKNNPIVIHNKSYKIYKDDNEDWFVEIGLFNNARKKELDIKRVEFKINNLHKSIVPILERVSNLEYKQGAGQITYDERKKKWFFGLAYTFEPEKEELLDPNKILGVDLGVVNTATFSIYNITNKTYERVKYNESIISGEEIRHYRNTIEKRRKELSRSTKWASENKTGHGRRQRMKDSDKIGDKCARFRDTYNHKVSRYLVNQAIKYKCGIIQMENLSGFSKEQENSMLKNWAYYDLQSKIKYKAEEVGIEFKLINPKYTSKRCSKCGCIHEDNRDCKNNQSKFQCVKCGHTENADINASKNIALPDIETIIVNTIKSNMKQN
jgi:IS605 OrfB family transposase